MTHIRTGRSSQTLDGDEADTQLPTGELSFLPERTCAICYQDQNPTSGKSESEVISGGANTGIIGNASTDITNPYETLECGCIYCFVCLARRIEAEEGEGLVCLRCGEVIRECKPWSGDVEEHVHGEVKGRSGRKSIAWADELAEKDAEVEQNEEPMEQVEPMPVSDDETED